MQRQSAREREKESQRDRQIGLHRQTHVDCSAFRFHVQDFKVCVSSDIDDSSVRLFARAVQRLTPPPSDMVELQPPVWQFTYQRHRSHSDV